MTLKMAGGEVIDIEGAGILSEIHPIAAGVYNTAYFVIVPKRTGHNSGTSTKSDKENMEPLTTSSFGISTNIPPRQKPKITYRELITRSLLEKESLTLSGIYKWISTNFPFFSESDDKWKNSIRHNLSLYPEFLKGSKTQSSAGHLWHLDHNLIKDSKDRSKVDLYYSPQLPSSENKSSNESFGQFCDDDDLIFDAIREHQQEQRSFIPMELQKTAEEILAGVKRPTKVHCNDISILDSCQPLSCLRMEEDTNLCWTDDPIYLWERES